MSQSQADSNAKSFRHALGCFPTGVAVITTTDAQGQPVGLTCNSFSSVSLEPPLVSWSLRKSSKSIEIFRQTKQFAINVLSHKQDDLSGRFASSSKTMAEKFAAHPYAAGWGSTPVLDDCIANFQCSVFASHDAGDHVIFIGQVEAFEQSSDEDALVFYKGAYMMLAQSLRALSQRVARRKLNWSKRVGPFIQRWFGWPVPRPSPRTCNLLSKTCGFSMATSQKAICIGAQKQRLPFLSS